MDCEGFKKLQAAVERDAEKNTVHDYHAKLALGRRSDCAMRVADQLRPPAARLVWCEISEEASERAGREGELVCRDCV